MNAITLQSKIRPARYEDIFATADDYADKARDIARRQVHAPINAMRATRSTPAQPANVTEGPKAELRLPETRKASSRQTDAQNLLFDMMTEPMTANQLAEKRGKDVSGVIRMLNLMERNGAVTSMQPGRVNGRLPAKLWDRAVKAYEAVHMQAEKGRISREKVMAALHGKMTAAQVADVIGYRTQYAREVLQKLQIEGRVDCETPEEWQAAGGYAPKLWSRVEQTPDEWVNAKVQGYDNRARIYAVLDTPKAPFEVADALAANRQTVAHIMRQMAERGLIVEAGRTRTDSGKPVKMWVRT
ncbi:hypothetical protein [Yoonia sp.]|uniref:hypothetical protein n=1 Tax=Yoonia sp. TaxID=2212373 RepID=UPI002DF8BE35|nr:hypothetical protein [Yoonia sp.]